MSDAERRRILEQVAAGELTPDEGAARLHDLDQPASGEHDSGEGFAEGFGQDFAHGFDRDDEDDDWDRGTSADEASSGVRTGPGIPPPGPEGGPATTIRVESSAATVRIVGDPSVAEAVADGRYTMRREGDVLIVETELPFDEWAEHAAYVVQFGGPHRRGRVRFRGSPFTRPAPLSVRMNPELPLEAVVNAGRLRIRGVRGPISCDVAAGTLRIDGFRGPLDCSVHAGSFAGRGRLTEGESEITCDAGGVRLDLEPESSVRLDVGVTLGRADIDGFERDPETGAWVVGGGRAALRVRSNLGSVKVRTLT